MEATPRVWALSKPELSCRLRELFGTDLELARSAGFDSLSPSNRGGVKSAVHVELDFKVHASRNGLEDHYARSMLRPSVDREEIAARIPKPPSA